MACGSAGRETYAVVIVFVPDAGPCLNCRMHDALLVGLAAVGVVQVSSLGEEEKSTLDAELAEMNFAPVHLTPDQVYGFYTSFSNGVLWPLFHYLLDKV